MIDQSPTDSKGEPLHVQPDEAGMRLDAYLRQRLGFSRSEARRVIARGAVKITGPTVPTYKKGTLLETGQTVVVAPFSSSKSACVIPEPQAHLNVLAAGDGYLAVDKPPGMPVHPLDPGERGTVLNSVVGRYPQVQGIGEGGLQSGVVHRLDVDTSGVLLLATNHERWLMLRAAFESHRIEKCYRAIVCGRLAGGRSEEMDLIVARHRPALVRVVESGRHESPGMRRCTLSWRAVESFEDASLLEVTLGTGFLHQIRVMLAHLEHPVVGDRLYGLTDRRVQAPRQMLHAAALHFGPINVAGADPPDFATVLAGLRGRRTK